MQCVHRAQTLNPLTSTSKKASMVGFLPLTPVSAPDCCLPPFFLCVHLRLFLPFVRFFLASVFACLCLCPFWLWVPPYPFNFMTSYLRLPRVHPLAACVHLRPLASTCVRFAFVCVRLRPFCCLSPFCLLLWLLVPWWGPLKKPTLQPTTPLKRSFCWLFAFDSYEVRPFER